MISYYGGKTIHTFTSSGTFTNPASISNVEYVIVAGGGGYGVEPTPALTVGENAKTNSVSGGGGGGGAQGTSPESSTPPARGLAGGSGIVLIAYPST